MNLNDLLLPLRRRWKAVLMATIVLTGGLFSLTYFGTQMEKATVYFSVKSVGEAPAGNHYYSAEGAERMAEAMSGWAKDPSFRATVLAEAEKVTGAPMVIDKFKQKISARKQNRLNVFYTLSLTRSEKGQMDALVTGLRQALAASLEQRNASASYPFALTAVESFSEWQTVPWLWVLVGALIMGTGLAIAGVYLYEGATGRVMHMQQVRELLGGAPVLSLGQFKADQAHALIHPFLRQLTSPKYLSLFPGAEDQFTLHTADELNPRTDTAVLLVRLGETKREDLQNLRAMCGDRVAAVTYLT